MSIYSNEDRARAEKAIRRGSQLGGPIVPCSCFADPPSPRGCFGACKDAVDQVSVAIAEEREKAAAEIARLRARPTEEEVAEALYLREPLYCTNWHGDKEIIPFADLPGGNRETRLAKASFILALFPKVQP